MSEKFVYYSQALANRDTTFIMLALIAVMIVGGWYLLKYVPIKYRYAFKRLYLVGGIVLYLFTLLVTVGGVTIQ